MVYKSRLQTMRFLHGHRGIFAVSCGCRTAWNRDLNRISWESGILVHGKSSKLDHSCTRDTTDLMLMSTVQSAVH